MTNKLSVFILLSMVFFSCTNSTDEEKHRIIQFRTIGHQLLLSSGDTTSRILPILKNTKNTYQIRFENTFEIIPDSLASIVVSNLRKTKPEKEYRVSVFTCNKIEMVYAFEWSPKRTESVTCLGRKLPDNCYIVEIEVITPTLNHTFLLTSSILVLIGIIAFLVLFKKKTPINEENTGEFRKVGSFNYFQQSGLLILKYQKIELSEKENKLLNILLSKPNETIARDFLINEIWEKEGVFVISRNLDVLVSKLRKKLVADTNVKISNSHGKGYKLEF